MALWGALRAAGSRLRMGNNPSTSMGLSNAATVNKIQETISDNCVVIFSKTTCTYCKMAKKLFQDMNVNYTAIELDMYENGSQFQDILHQMTGGRTERSSNELLPVSKHLTRLGKGCLNPLFTGDSMCLQIEDWQNDILITMKLQDHLWQERWVWPQQYLVLEGDHIW
ncbi:glutaredoxin 2 isoform X1 [Eretmochelys imbricata]